MFTVYRLSFLYWEKHYIDQYWYFQRDAVNLWTFSESYTIQRMRFSIKDFFSKLTKSAISWGFGHNYWKNLKWKNSFFCAVLLPNNGKRFFQTSYQTTLILSEDFYAIMLHAFPEFISTNYRNYQTIPTFSKGRYQTIVKTVFNAETFK